MEYSTVFDKCSSPVNWVEPRKATVVKQWLNEMEARAGVEPTYTDLQSGA